MRKIEHALSGAVYEWAEDDLGPVLVTDRKGRQGRFDRDGRWVTGEVRRADPELCRWIASGGQTAGRSRVPQSPLRGRGDVLLTAETRPQTGFLGNGPSYQDLLDLDSKPVPASMRRNQPGYFGEADIPVERYLVPGVPRAREGAALVAGMAVRLPRGGPRRGRRHRGLRHLRHVDLAGSRRTRS